MGITAHDIDVLLRKQAGAFAGNLQALFRGLARTAETYGRNAEKRSSTDPVEHGRRGFSEQQRKAMWITRLAEDRDVDLELLKFLPNFLSPAAWAYLRLQRLPREARSGHEAGPHRDTSKSAGVMPSRAIRTRTRRNPALPMPGACWSANATNCNVCGSSLIRYQYRAMTLRRPDHTPHEHREISEIWRVTRALLRIDRGRR